MWWYKGNGRKWLIYLFFMHNFNMFSFKLFRNDLKTAIYNNDSIAQVFMDHIPLLNWAQQTYWKIQDYDRLQEDYEKLLWHCTLGRFSKSSYFVDDMIREIDDAQAEKHGGAIKDDIFGILEGIDTHNTDQVTARIHVIKHYLTNYWN